MCRTKSYDDPAIRDKRTNEQASNMMNDYLQDYDFN